MLPCVCWGSTVSFVCFPLLTISVFIRDAVSSFIPSYSISCYGPVPFMYAGLLKFLVLLSPFYFLLSSLILVIIAYWQTTTTFHSLLVQPEIKTLLDSRLWYSTFMPRLGDRNQNLRRCTMKLWVGTEQATLYRHCRCLLFAVDTFTTLLHQRERNANYKRKTTIQTSPCIHLLTIAPRSFFFFCLSSASLSTP